MQQDKPTINLTVPTGWDKLDDHQLRYVFGLLAQGFPSPQVKTYCLFRWTGMQVMHKYGRGWWCKFADDELRKRESGGASANSNKFGLRSACTEFVIMAEQVNSAIAALDWIDSLPSKPVRISRIGKHRALTADFQEVPFETFIICDNLYQGYLSAREDTLLDVIDTVSLLASPKILPLRADGRFFEVEMSQSFLEYGLWQDYGTGLETPRGNSGDFGRAKKRQRRRWLSRKYYASVMRLKEFYEENIGKEFCGLVTNALSRRDFLSNHK